jgi:hypothetical protein
MKENYASANLPNPSTPYHSTINFSSQYFKLPLMSEKPLKEFSAAQWTVFFHETAHAVFGAVDDLSIETTDGPVYSRFYATEFSFHEWWTLTSCMLTNPTDAGTLADAYAYYAHLVHHGIEPLDKFNPVCSYKMVKQVEDNLQRILKKSKKWFGWF